MDILEEIVAHKVEELQERMDFISPRRLYSLVEEKIKKETSAPASMRQALMDSPTGIIAEFKRKSPSKGWIKQEGKAHRHEILRWLRRIYPAGQSRRRDNTYII